MDVSRQEIKEEQIRMAEELLFSDVKGSSFAKKLYFGKIDSQRLFPYPRPSQDEIERVDKFIIKLEAFLDEHLDPDAIDRNAEIPQNVILGLGEIGLLSMSIPKKYGGLGFTQYGFCRGMSTLSARCGGTAVFVNAHQVVGLRAIMMFGTEEQKKTWLPCLAKGEKIAAFALTEENAGSDAAGVETTAIYNAEKDVYIINGTKRYITNGGIAGMLTVMAQTEIETSRGKEQHISAFIVTPDMPGFTVIDKAMEKVGIRGTMTAKLEFKNVEVPAANILGKLGGGLKMALTVLDFGRITFGATCLGVSKFAFEQAVKHSQNRVQFKEPIGHFELIKKKLARMAAYTYAMEATNFVTAGIFDRGEEDYMCETAIIKVFASESAWSIINDTIQVFGGQAFFCDEPYERMMRDARLNTIGEGANEVLLNFIALVGIRDVGKQMEGLLNSLKSPLKWPQFIGGALNALKPILFPEYLPIKSSELQYENRKYTKCLRKFAWKLKIMLAKYQEGIFEEQLILERIANTVISLYTTASVLSLLDSDLSNPNTDLEKLTKDLGAGKLYCQIAFDKIDENMTTLTYNYDNNIIKVADSYTGLS